MTSFTPALTARTSNGERVGLAREYAQMAGWSRAGASIAAMWLVTGCASNGLSTVPVTPRPSLAVAVVSAPAPVNRRFGTTERTAKVQPVQDPEARDARAAAERPLPPPKKTHSTTATYVVWSEGSNSETPVASGTTEAPRFAPNGQVLTLGTGRTAGTPSSWVVLSTTVSKRTACTPIADEKHLQMRVRLCRDQKQ